MIKVVGIRFRNAGKIYYFDPKDFEMEVARIWRVHYDFHFIASSISFISSSVRLKYLYNISSFHFFL